MSEWYDLGEYGEYDKIIRNVDEPNLFRLLEGDNWDEMYWTEMGMQEIRAVVGALEWESAEAIVDWYENVVGWDYVENVFRDTEDWNALYWAKEMDLLGELHLITLMSLLEEGGYREWR